MFIPSTFRRPKFSMQTTKKNQKSSPVWAVPLDPVVAAYTRMPENVTEDDKRYLALLNPSAARSSDCTRCTWARHNEIQSVFPKVTTKEEFAKLLGDCTRQQNNACCERMRLCWSFLRTRVDAQKHHVLGTSPPAVKSKGSCVPNPLEVIAQLTRSKTFPIPPITRRTSRKEANGQDAAVPSRPKLPPRSKRTASAPAELVSPPKKRKREIAMSSNDKPQKAARPSKRAKRHRKKTQHPSNGSPDKRVNGIDERTVHHDQPKQETANVSAGTTKQRKAKAIGAYRDDTTKRGAQQFGHRLYNYFNFLSDQCKITPEELISRRVFGDGQRILPDLKQENARYADEQQLIKQYGFDKSQEKHAIYRVAKYQTVLADVIYCEHNLRLTNKAFTEGTELKKKDLFSFNPTAIQYFLNRDATTFAKILRQWQGMGFFPEMFADPQGTSVSQEMLGFASAVDRKRIYEAFVAWEDANRADTKILIRS